MEKDELPDKIIEIPPGPQPEGSPNPLTKKKILVTKFSRHKIMILSCVVFLITALACAHALTQRKVVPAQENSESASKDAQYEMNPSLPEGAAAVPAKYGDPRQSAAASVPAGSARDFQVGSGAAGGSVDPAISQPGVSPAASPAQQTAQARDQRLKDSVSATRAPLAFTGLNSGGDGGGTRMQESMPAPRSLEPNPDVKRVLDRLTAGPGESDDQNQQNEKRGFTKEDRKDFPYLKTTLLTPLSPYEVKAGAILPGVLITGINSDLPGQITAQARENVYDTVSGRYLLIPIGSRYIGEYDSKISYGQERVLVVWTRIIMPNGNSISLENMPGIDLSGYAGVSGRVNNHYGKLVTGVVLGSILGATAQVAVGGQGSPNTPPSFGQLATAGAASNMNQAGQRITEKNLNLQPTIEVSPGAKINIFVTKDMILKPYID
jgi:type IV secretion system protein TrbI